MSNAVVTGVQPVENEHNVADAKQVRGPISRLILDASVRKGLQPTPDQLGHSIPVGCRDKSFIYHLPEHITYNAVLSNSSFLHPSARLRSAAPQLECNS